MDLERGVLARIDRRLLAELAHTGWCPGGEGPGL